MDIKMKNILFIDDEMDNHISNTLSSNIVEKINVFNSPIEALEYLVIQNQSRKFPDAIFLTSIC
jgi:hypothetical protein